MVRCGDARVEVRRVEGPGVEPPAWLGPGSHCHGKGERILWALGSPGRPLALRVGWRRFWSGTHAQHFTLLSREGCESVFNRSGWAREVRDELVKVALEDPGRVGLQGLSDEFWEGWSVNVPVSTIHDWISHGQGQKEVEEARARRRAEIDRRRRAARNKGRGW